MNKILYPVILLLVLFSFPSFKKDVIEKGKYQLVSFGEGGTKKMTYDRRQHPQAVLIGDVIYLVYNGGAPADAEKMVKTLPYITSYNLKTGSFSETIQLPGEPSKDHHYGPVIWADNNNFLHVLSGCHKTPGTHVMSKSPKSIGAETEDWKISAQVAPSLSYPSFSQVIDNQQLIYYRTHEHRSSWTYSISADNGKTWQTPGFSIVDLNRGDELLGKEHKDTDEASSYHTYMASKDGRFLHIAFVYYDDNKGELPEKAYNPLYKKDVGTLKTNLYYIKVDLRTNAVTNFEGKIVNTPVSLKQANEDCKIWDTNWRGTGIPPDIIIEGNGNPAFLHVLTEENIEELNYYFVRRVDNQWKRTIIAPACHKWNSSHIQIDEKGNLHAFLLMDDAYFESNDKGVMNSHGGGTRIEEWISTDNGNTWNKKEEIFKAEGEFDGWRFNNIQPIKTKEGTIKQGMWLFYGWNELEGEVARAKAFLLFEKTKN